MTQRKRSAAFLVAILFGLSAPCWARADEPPPLDDDVLHYGPVEYEISCLPCHGVDGRGDGPLAPHLAVAPPDLTGIAAANGGVFPSLRVLQIIDGRALVSAHGSRDMPVWGDRYRAQVPDDQELIDIEREALARLAALVRYLESLQEPTSAGPD